MIFRKHNFAAAALAACILGLAICPFLYIAIGALAAFAPAFTFVMVPPFLLGSGFLLRRFLSKPTDRPMSGVPLLVTEGVSWGAIVTFLFYVSGINLMTGLERFGAACTFFLVASAGCLPVVLMRKTALEQRLTQLPNRIAIIVLLLILAVSGLAMIAYLITPPAFI